MKPHIKVEIYAGTLAAMTTPQFEALKENILAEGKWETADGVKVTGHGDYIGVQPMSGTSDAPGAMTPIMFIGIEKDGYTHS